jgi:hypothetical protein
MKLLKFSQYISENRDIEGAKSQAVELGKTSAKINRLVELGLVDDAGYRNEFKKIIASYRKLVKGLNLNYQEHEDLEILNNLGQLSGMNTLIGLESDGAKALFAKGLHMVSSPTQLMNGTIVFSLDPAYRSKDGWGIGFFPGPKVIRRMTPKGINIGIWNRQGSMGSMNIEIKKFKDTGSAANFFNQAMLWAAEKIDFEHATLYPEPTVWKYNVKKKTAPTRTEADSLLIQAKELSNQAAEFMRTDRPKYLNQMLAALDLKLRAAVLKNDASLQTWVQDSIDRINTEKNLKFH